MSENSNRQQSRIFRDLVARLDARVQAAFLAAVDDLRDGLDWQALIAALEAGDISSAIDALHIDEAAFYQYATTKTDGYAQAGIAAMTTVNTPPGAGTVGVRFDMSNPRAEAWIRDNVAQRVQQVSEETKQAAREVIQDGYAAGRHPHEIARSVAGRSVNGGPREGGIIGLDGPRAARLEAVTQAMKTKEGVASLVVKGRDGKLKLRVKVNKATEARIIKAYRDSKAVSAKDQATSIKQFSNALLKDRADTIAQTETLQAVMNARYEAWKQAAEANGYDDDAIIKTWTHGGGPKEPRPHHVAMSGHSVRGLDTQFKFFNGAQLRFAGDAAAPASEVIRCTCDTTFRLDHSRGVM